MSGGKNWLFGLLAAFLVFVGLWLTGWQHAARLERELADARQTIENLHIDHRDTMDALNRAMLAREKINGQARIQEQKLADTLKNDPLADTVLSDDFRMCLQWDENGDCAAAGSPAPGNQDSGSRQDENGGRHGRANR